jgi:hypothetical protein
VPDENTTPEEVRLTDDDVAFLISVLREPGRPQPVTTQQLVEALRTRNEQ